MNMPSKYEEAFNEYQLAISSLLQFAKSKRYSQSEAQTQKKPGLDLHVDLDIMLSGTFKIQAHIQNSIFSGSNLCSQFKNV